MARRVQVAEQADAASSDKERLSSSPRGQSSVRKHASAQPLHLSQELEAATFPLTKSTSRDEKRRAAIFSGLLLANEDAWASLLQVTDVESAQKVASSLVRLFAAEGQDLKLVKYCIMKDVADTQEEALLLRGSGIYPAIVAYAGLYHGRTYLQTVIAPVLHIVLSRPSSSFEIDPRRAGSEEAAKKNAENLVNAANHVIAALLSNIEEMPIALRRTFEFAQRCVSGKFPAHGIRLVTNLFFLRLLCPALVAPEEYGLCKSRPSDTTMRAHILLAKLLQSVANEVPPFGKEEYMQPLNRWVEAAVPSVRRFFKIALNIVHTDKLDVPSVLCKLHAIPNATETADGKDLFQFARSNYVAYREHLTAAKAKEALEILREILPEEEIANRSPPRAHRVGSDYGSDGSSPRSSDSRLKQ